VRMGQAKTKEEPEKVHETEAASALPPGIEVNKDSRAIQDIAVPVLRAVPEEWDDPCPLSIPFSVVDSDEATADRFRASLRDRGYAIISIDDDKESEEVESSIRGYYEAGKGNPVGDYQSI